MQQVTVTRWSDGSVEVGHVGGTAEEAKGLLYSTVLAMQEEDHAAKAAKDKARARRNERRRERVRVKREAKAGNP